MQMDLLAEKPFRFILLSDEVVTSLGLTRGMATLLDSRGPALYRGH